MFQHINNNFLINDLLFEFCTFFFRILVAVSFLFRIPPAILAAMRDLGRALIKIIQCP